MSKNRAAYRFFQGLSNADVITPTINIALAFKRGMSGDRAFFVPDHYGNAMNGWNSNAIQADLKRLGIKMTNIPSVDPTTDELIFTVSKKDAKRVQDFLDRAEVGYWPNIDYGDEANNPRLSSSPVRGLSASDSQDFQDEINAYWEEHTK